MSTRTHNTKGVPVSSFVSIEKIKTFDGKTKFGACIEIGKRGACAIGTNPRKALGTALRHLADQTERRSGFFAGQRRKRR